MVFRGLLIKILNYSNMEWQETYKILAIEFDATISDIVRDMYHLENALNAIVNIDTTNEGSIYEYGLEASTQLLYPMHLFYLQARQHYSYDDYRRQMVKRINDFTIRYFGDLTTFVNNISWDEGCIPYYWVELSEAADFDVSGWNSCS